MLMCGAKIMQWSDYATVKKVLKAIWIKAFVKDIWKKWKVVVAWHKSNANGHKISAQISTNW